MSFAESLFMFLERLERDKQAVAAAAVVLLLLLLQPIKMSLFFLLPTIVCNQPDQ